MRGVFGVMGVGGFGLFLGGMLWFFFGCKKRVMIVNKVSDKFMIVDFYY